MVMKRIEIAKGLTLSQIAYGMWRMADDVDGTGAHLQAKLEAALSQGITTVDLADIYGEYTAEGRFGQMLTAAKGLRNRIEIITKCGIIAPVGRHASARVRHYDSSARHIAAAVDTSLSEMRTDRIDLLLLHSPDPLMDPDDTARGLDGLIQSGKVRAVGVSNFRPYDIDLLQSRMKTRLCVNQIEISLAMSDPFTNGDLAYLQEHKIVSMAWSPLEGGALFAGSRPALLIALREMAAAKQCDLAALAVAWLLNHPAGIVPVIGTTTIDRIVKLADASEVELDREDWFTLYAASIGHDVP